METQGYGCVPIKLYLQQQAMSWIWLVGGSLPISSLEQGFPIETVWATHESHHIRNLELSSHILESEKRLLKLILILSLNTIYLKYHLMCIFKLLIRYFPILFFMSLKSRVSFTHRAHHHWGHKWLAGDWLENLQVWNPAFLSASSGSPGPWSSA